MPPVHRQHDRGGTGEACEKREAEDEAETRKEAERLGRVHHRR